MDRKAISGSSSSSFSGFNPSDRPIPISELYLAPEITCKQRAPSSLDYQDVITTTSSLYHTEVTTVLSTHFNS